MSAWDLYPEVGREIVSSSRSTMGPPEPGAFSGIMGAIGRAFPAAYNEALSAITGVATEYGRAAAITYGAPRSQSVDLLGSPAPIADQYRAQAKALIPDPLTTGAASRFVFDATRILTKAGTLTLAGGPLAGAVGTGGLEGTLESQKLRDQGVDAMTAAKVGAIKGVATGVGLALPIAGRTLLETAGLVIAGGPVSFMAEKAASRAVLEHADYSGIAHEYDPFDPMGLALSAAVPGIFGAAVHSARAVGASRAARRAAVSSEEVDAARTVQLAQHVDETRLADPGNAQGAESHVEALNTARAQLDAGERVSVADVVPRTDLGAPGRAALQAVSRSLTEAQVSARAIEIVRAEAEPALIAQAGASDVPIAGVREQVDTLERQIRELTETRAETIKATARDLQSQREMKFQDARTEATKLYDARVADLEASSARLTEQIARSQAVEQARQELGTLSRNEIPERLQAAYERRVADLMKALDEKPLSVAVREAMQAIETGRQADAPALAQVDGAVPRSEAGAAPRVDQPAVAIPAARAAEPAARDTAQGGGNKGGEPGGEGAREPGAERDPVADAAKAVVDEVPDLRVIDELTGEEVTAAELWRRAEELYQVEAREAEAYPAAVSCFLRSGA